MLVSWRSNQVIRGLKLQASSSHFQGWRSTEGWVHLQCPVVQPIMPSEWGLHRNPKGQGLEGGQIAEHIENLTRCQAGEAIKAPALILFTLSISSICLFLCILCNIHCNKWIILVFCEPLQLRASWSEVQVTVHMHLALELGSFLLESALSLWDLMHGVTPIQFYLRGKAAYERYLGIHLF